jgi:mannosyltransferase OCH1-like enzyme
MIERTIHYFFHDLNAMHPRFRKAVDTTVAANPDCPVEMWDDARAVGLLEDAYPHLLPLYRRIRIPAVRCDLIRLAILHRHGGLYADIVYAIAMDVRDLCDGHDHVLLRVDNASPYRGRVHVAHLSNAMIGASKGAELMLDCLKRVHFNLSTHMTNYTVSTGTGPQMLTEAYYAARDRLRNVRIVDKSELSRLGITLHQAAGVNNRWVEMQRDGIVDGPAPLRDARPHELAWQAALAPG